MENPKFGRFNVQHTSESIAKETKEAYADRAAVQRVAASSLLGFVFAKVGGERSADKKIADVNEIIKHFGADLQEEAEQYAIAFENYQGQVAAFSGDFGIEVPAKGASDFIDEHWRQKLVAKKAPFSGWYQGPYYTPEDDVTLQALTTVFTQTIPRGKSVETEKGVIVSQNEVLDFRKDITVSLETATATARERGVDQLIRVLTYVGHKIKRGGFERSGGINRVEAYIVPSNNIISALEKVGGEIGSHKDGLYLLADEEPFFKATRPEAHQSDPTRTETETYARVYSAKLVTIPDTNE